MNENSIIHAACWNGACFWFKSEYSIKEIICTEKAAVGFIKLCNIFFIHQASSPCQMLMRHTKRQWIFFKGSFNKWALLEVKITDLVKEKILNTLPF